MKIIGFSKRPERRRRLQPGPPSEQTSSQRRPVLSDFKEREKTDLNQTEPRCPPSYVWSLNPNGQTASSFSVLDRTHATRSKTKTLKIKNKSKFMLLTFHYSPKHKSPNFSQFSSEQKFIFSAKTQ